MIYLLMPAVLLFALYLILGFHECIGLKNRCLADYEVMEGYHRQRCALIPDLVESVKRFAPEAIPLAMQVVGVEKPAGEGSMLDQCAQHQRQTEQKLNSLIEGTRGSTPLRQDFLYRQKLKQLHQIQENINKAQRLYNEAAAAYNQKAHGPVLKFFSRAAGLGKFPYFGTGMQEERRMMVSVASVVQVSPGIK